MIDIFQSFLNWISEYADPLTKIGTALVVVIGALWQVYLHFERQRKKPEPAALTSSPISGIRVEVVPSTASPLTTQRAPLIEIEGKYRFSTYPKQQRRFMLFGCAFIAFWCFVLFQGAISTFGDLQFHYTQLLPYLVFMFMLYFGMALFLSQVMLLIGKVRVYADADMIFVSRSLGVFFANHTVILAREWRFDGEVFVSRKDGTKVSVPELPKYVNSELERALSVTWR